MCTKTECVESSVTWLLWRHTGCFDAWKDGEVSLDSVWTHDTTYMTYDAKPVTYNPPSHTKQFCVTFEEQTKLLWVFRWGCNHV